MKQILNKHNMTKNPNWQEADQLAIYLFIYLFIYGLYAPELDESSTVRLVGPVRDILMGFNFSDFFLSFVYSNIRNIKIFFICILIKVPVSTSTFDLVGKNLQISHQPSGGASPSAGHGLIRGFLERTLTPTKPQAAQAGGKSGARFLGAHSRVTCLFHSNSRSDSFLSPFDLSA